MHITHLTDDLRRGIAAMPAPTVEQQDHLEVRLLSVFVTLSFLNDLAGPIAYIYQLSPSLLYKVASLSHGTWLVGAMFVLALALAVPHAVALVCFPRTLHIKWPRRAATLAAVIVTVAWAYLAVLSLPLDAGPLVWLYLRQALESVALAFLYAISLNAQLLRALNQLIAK